MAGPPAPWLAPVCVHQMAVLLSPVGGGLSESNLENEAGSISGSDSTFYRQSEGKAAWLTAAEKLVGRLEGWNRLAMTAAVP